MLYAISNPINHRKGFFGNLMFSIIQHHLGPVSVAISRDNSIQVNIKKKQIEEKGGEESEYLSRPCFNKKNQLMVGNNQHCYTRYSNYRPTENFN